MLEMQVFRPNAAAAERQQGSNGIIRRIELAAGVPAGDRFTTLTELPILRGELTSTTTFPMLLPPCKCATASFTASQTGEPRASGLSPL